LVVKALLGVESLFGGGELELVGAILAGQSDVLEVSVATILFLFLLVLGSLGGLAFAALLLLGLLLLDLSLGLSLLALLLVRRLCVFLILFGGCRHLDLHITATAAFRVAHG
jgi:hypothetical protein